MVTEIELHAREHGCEKKQTTLQSDTRRRGCAKATPKQKRFRCHTEYVRCQCVIKEEKYSRHLREGPLLYFGKLGLLAQRNHSLKRALLRECILTL